MGKKPKNNVHFRHNPAFLDKKRLVHSFVGFESELQLLLEALIQKKTNLLMIVAPSGGGKTTMVLRIAEEIRFSDSHSSLLYPVVFPEESHDISSIGEFWFKVLVCMGEALGNTSLMSSCLGLKTEKNEMILLQKSFKLLNEIQLELNRTLLIVIENLNMVLGQQLSFKDALEFNKIIQHIPSIKIVGTSLVPIKRMKPTIRELFECYKIIELKPFNMKTCGLLYKTVSGDYTATSHIRMLQILTQGNPRFFKDLSSLCSRGSFAELSENLIKFIDYYTPYFKSQLNSLPPLERKVLTILADIWDPATARDIAGLARIDVNKASAYLQRLLSKGILRVVHYKGRRQWYQIREPMYNLYLIIRSRQGYIIGRLKAVIFFMVHFYCKNSNRIIYDFKDEIITDFPLKTIDIKDLGITVDNDALSKKQLLILEEIEQDISMEPDNPSGWTKLGMLLMNTPYREKDAETVFKKSITLDSKAFIPSFCLGLLYAKKPARYTESIKAFKQALKYRPDDARSWFNLAVVLGKKPDSSIEAENAYKKSIDLNPEDQGAWNNLATLLSSRENRFDDCHAAFLKAIELKPDDNRIWTNFGLLLSSNRAFLKQSENAYKKAIEFNPNGSGAWLGLGLLQQSQTGLEKRAINYFKKAVELNKTDAGIWMQLIRCYLAINDHGAAVKTSRQMVAILKPSPDILNELALCFSGCKNTAILEQAETWIKAACNYKKDHPDYLFTWSLILGNLGKWDKSIQLSYQCMLNDKFVRQEIKSITDYYCEAAAQGFAQTIINSLDVEKTNHILEPLKTGLKLFLGRDCRTAREIKEIGKDICEKIKLKRGAINE